MNDRHPSGTAHYAAYDGYSTTTSFVADPLFGDLPGNGPYDTGSHETGTYATAAYDTGSYDTGQWHTSGEQQQHQQQYAAPYTASPYDTSTFETPTFETSTFDTSAYTTSAYDTGSYDTTAMWAVDNAGYEQQHTGQWGAQTYDTQTFEAPVFGTTAYDTGAYDATAWNSDGGVSDGTAMHDYVPDLPEPEPNPHPNPVPNADPELGPVPVPDPAEPQAASSEPEFTRRAAPRGGRSRRRTPAKRSALLTIAVPSVCVVGVAGVAAASVGGIGGEDDGKETQAASAPDASAVKPSVANNKLDTQLKDLSADAGDFADRASRTQERIDLKAKQEADRKKAAEAAAHKEAMRPKFALPVKRHGLSAYYGQAGINWMSVHTGIDFPVSYGTEVMSATDGTVRTQWNSAYGNMAIVTAKDGTETWYCHLSSHTVMSGPVKAGDVIAHSGNSGNSTGPHLHFEVRPGGGSAIDPLPWLRSHGLDPT
ncbi:peptidoglycan DD-metalloendopeptidase family protein [Streptomyces sp. NPDC102467]|uniref:M23 family metallopeptidase n=1 Tax=Streptomyces sp. NPDC102467 TaxID=3366179 RepID=UPI0037F1A8AC